MTDTLFVERSFAQDAQAERHVEALRLAIAPLDLLREELDAPAGLAVRTCQRIGEARQVRSDW
jgi:hypothetical protein